MRKSSLSHNPNHGFGDIPFAQPDQHFYAVLILIIPSILLLLILLHALVLILHTLVLILHTLVPKQILRSILVKVIARTDSSTLT